MRSFLNRLSAAHVFVGLALLFGLLFIFSTPLLWGQDEMTHFGRAYQISRGHMLPATIPTSTGPNYGGMIPKSAYKLLIYATSDLGAGGQAAQKNNGIGWVRSPKEYEKLGSQPLNGPKQFLLFPNTAPYSPVAYLPSAFGLGVSQLLDLDLTNAIHLARLCALTFYIIAIYFLLRSLQRFRAKWIIFAIALLPTSLYQASTITADTMTMIVMLIVSGLFLKTLLRERLSKVETYIFLGGIILLPMVKPTYLLFIFLLLLTPQAALSITPKLSKIVRYGALGVSLLIFAYWSHATSGLTNAPKLALPHFWAKDINPQQQLHQAVSHPVTVAQVFLRTTLLNDGYYWNGAIGQFGYSNVLAPGLAMVSSTAAMALSVVGMEKLKIGRAKLLWICGVVIGSIIALYGAFYLTITPVMGIDGPISQIVQGILGRYFVPYFVLALVIVGGLFPARLSTAKHTSKSLAIGVTSLVLLSLLASFLKYFYVLWG